MTCNVKVTRTLVSEAKEAKMKSSHRSGRLMLHLLVLLVLMTTRGSNGIINNNRHGHEHEHDTSTPESDTDKETDTDADAEDDDFETVDYEDEDDPLLPSSPLPSGGSSSGGGGGGGFSHGGFGHGANANANHHENAHAHAHALEAWAYDVIWFQQEPEDAYIVKTKGGVATLTCKVAAALKVYFQCNGKMVPRSRQLYHQFMHTSTGAPITQVQLNVTREDIQEESGSGGPGSSVGVGVGSTNAAGAAGASDGGDFLCECVAANKRETKISPPVHVRVAYLKKYFEQSPYSKHVEIDSQTELRCIPPDGLPHPTITWVQDGRVIERENTNYIITADGHLLIAQTKLSDMGNYSCIAENVASRRISEAALLTVYVNGGWSSWGEWSECQGSCGKGVERRSRTCSNPIPLNGGRPCAGSATQKQECLITCPPIDGRWSPWTGWSICGADCRQYKRRTCSNPGPAYGGRNCSGKDTMYSNCTGGLCKEFGAAVHDGGSQSIEPASAPAADSHGDDGDSSPSILDPSTTTTSTRGQAKALADADIALYIGLAVAIIIFSVVAVIVMRLMRRKGGRSGLEAHLGMYDMAPNDYPIGYYPDPTKKSSSGNGAGGGSGGAAPDLCTNVHTSGSNSTSAYTCSTSSGGGGAGGGMGANNSTIIHVSGQLPLCYEYSYPGSPSTPCRVQLTQEHVGAKPHAQPPLSFSPDTSEHLYDVPQLPNNNLLQLQHQQQTTTLSNFSTAATASPSSDDNNSGSAHNHCHSHQRLLKPEIVEPPGAGAARKPAKGTRLGHASLERIMPRSMSSSTTASSDTSSFSSTDDSCCSGPNSILYEMATAASSTSSPTITAGAGNETNGHGHQSSAAWQQDEDEDDGLSYAVDPRYIVWATATSTGCRLSLKEAAINLTIPEGSLSGHGGSGSGGVENIYCGLITKEKNLPPLGFGQTLLSPVISTGPSSVALRKPAILSFHHCAALKYGGWKISLYHHLVTESSARTGSWQKLVTIGEETIQTPVFIQLDTNQVFLVTDQLEQFALIGEAAESMPRPVKTLRLAVFGPSSSAGYQQSSSEYSVRVYVMLDTATSLERVLAREKKLGGRLLDKPKPCLFQDAEEPQPLAISLEDVGSGWRCKSGASYQEIPFNQIWSCYSHLVHEFELEKVERRSGPGSTTTGNNGTGTGTGTSNGGSTICFRLVAYQTGVQLQKQTFRIRTELNGGNTGSSGSGSSTGTGGGGAGTSKSGQGSLNGYGSPAHNHRHLLSPSPRHAHGHSSQQQYNQPHVILSPKSSTVSMTTGSTSAAAVSVDSPSPLVRLPAHLRKRLCHALDAQAQSGKDWRLLAHKLYLDKYISFLASKSSPTEHILDLWDVRARSRPAALTDLLNALRSMDRPELVSAFEKEMGPWI